MVGLVGSLELVGAGGGRGGATTMKTTTTTMTTTMTMTRRRWAGGLWSGLVGDVGYENG